EIITLHWDWFKERNDGIPPQMNGVEGKAAEQLVSYFETVARAKAEKNNEIVSEHELKNKAAGMFEYILSKWNSLEPFLQKQTKISQINSNITNIINYLKNGTRTQ